MTKIKIISNPYENQISYEKFHETAQAWNPIDNESSRLHTEKLTKSVFPFVVKDIVDQILNEFRTGTEPISIVFEGTYDEYRELESVCSEPAYDAVISVSISDRYLRNARDILPDVKEIFDHMQPLIAESVKDNDRIEREKRQFADVSKEAIPVCVLGNYSSGKSTFINALIGYEILPSGDDPVTAKIHRIERSEYEDRASVRFDYDGERVEIILGEPNVPSINVNIDNDLFRQFRKALDDSASAPITCRVSKILEIINNGDNAAFVDRLSDMIEIKVPFNQKGIFGRTQNKFVVFDTPGSNTASNGKHFEVLKKAMEDLSNGLPIYLSEYDKLDTKDNESLCRLIRDMKELDSRFTMIVVNKADKANFGKTGLDEEAILGQTIPRNLYSSGLYFVSSIMGLGSKNDGRFENEFYEETFSDQERKFSDPESKYYKKLYAYNITPEQIKQKAMERSEQSANRVLANSGLYWVEEEIEKFAGIYSPYNKCHQSMLFLEKVIAITSNEIEASKRMCEKTKQQMEEKLEAGKAALINELQQRSAALHSAFACAYQEGMRPFMGETVFRISKETLADHQEKIAGKMRGRTNYDALRDSLGDAQKAAADQTRRLLFDRNNLSSFSDSIRTTVETYKDSREKRMELSGEQKKLDRIVSDQLLADVKEDFDGKIAQAQASLNAASANYWTNKCAEMKEALAKQVAGSSALTDEKRAELAEIIMTCTPVPFDKQADDIFVDKEFRRRQIDLGPVVLGNNNKLALGRLAKRFNSEYEDGIKMISQSIQKSHELGFRQWAEGLLQKIRENITEYNTDLNELVQIIADQEKRIRDLENRQLRLARYTHDIEDKMAWKTLSQSDGEVE